MTTRVYVVDPVHPDRAILQQAAAILRRGGLVAFPTETVYGLGGNALDAAAVARIFAAKGRPARNPLIVHVAETAQALQVAAVWPEVAERLARSYWPGPLTLVLPRRDHLPDAVTAQGPTVAVRVPAHPVARELLRAAALPIAAPSANRSNRLSPTRAEHVLHDLDGRIDMLLDAGPTPGGIESTVVDVSCTPPCLLRPGLIDATALENVLGPLTLTQSAMDSPGPLPAPGMLARHYAPRTPLECMPANGAERAIALCHEGWQVGLLTFAPIQQTLPAEVTVRVLPDEPAAAASRLYAVLHELDAAQLDRLVATLPPDTKPWLAVRDRLRRASS